MSTTPNEAISQSNARIGRILQELSGLDFLGAMLTLAYVFACMEIHSQFREETIEDMRNLFAKQINTCNALIRKRLSEREAAEEGKHIETEQNHLSN
jgi:hypothetical protein